MSRHRASAGPASSCSHRERGNSDKHLFIQQWVQIRILLGFPGGEQNPITRCGRHCVHGIPTCCCCSVYSHSLCQYFCHSKSQPVLQEAKWLCLPKTVPLQNPPQQPQLALSLSAGSVMKMHLSIASHTLLCGSRRFCPTPSPVLPSLQSYLAEICPET